MTVYENLHKRICNVLTLKESLDGCRTKEDLIKKGLRPQLF